MLKIGQIHMNLLRTALEQLMTLLMIMMLNMVILTKLVSG